MALVYNPQNAWLLSGAAANNVSAASGFDCRGAPNFGIGETKCTAQSAIIDWLFSPDGVDWGTALTVTATNGGTAFHQFSAYYPFVNVAARLIYSGANVTASAYAYYRPGTKQ